MSTKKFRIGNSASCNEASLSICFQYRLQKVFGPVAFNFL
jgi:hypothetical protein